MMDYYEKGNLYLEVFEEDSPLPGVEVTLINIKSGKEIIIVTNETGRCRFLSIMPGEYNVKFVLYGFSQKYLECVSINPGETKKLSVNMSFNAIKECLVVGPPTIKSIKSKSVKDKIFEMIEDLRVGKILFNPPKVMKLGVVKRVEVRISQNINETISEGLKGKGIPRIEEIKVSPVMNVILSGDDFSIKSYSDSEQIISQSGFSQWEWDVTPLKTGTRFLYLSVSVVLKIRKYGEKKKSFPVMEKKIIVKINLGYRIVNFVKKHWKWIITTLLIPFIVFLYKAFIEK